MSTADLSFWENLARKQTHAIQLRILERTRAGEVLSPARFAEDEDLPLSNVGYHFTALRKKGLLKLDRTEPRRGALEHFYKAPEREAVPA